MHLGSRNFLPPPDPLTPHPRNRACLPACLLSSSGRRCSRPGGNPSRLWCCCNVLLRVPAAASSAAHLPPLAWRRFPPSPKQNPPLRNKRRAVQSRLTRRPFDPACAISIMAFMTSLVCGALVNDGMHKRTNAVSPGQLSSFFSFPFAHPF